MKYKKIKISLIIFICLSTLIILIANCSQKVKREENVTRKISIETISSKENKEILTVSGNIVPVETVKLSFKLPGVIDEVLHKDGDPIEEGEKIASLDISDYSIAQSVSEADYEMAISSVNASQAQYEAALSEYEAAKIQVETEIPSKTNQAKAQLDLTQATYDRVKLLYEADAASQSQMDEITAKLLADKETYRQALDAKSVAEVKLEAAKSKVEAYEAQTVAASAQASKADSAVQKATNDLDDTALYSPINGVILKKIMNEGEVTGSGYPVVVIGRTDEVYGEFGVPDQYINQLSTGQEAYVEVYGVNKTYKGTIAEIGSLADSTTRTFTVRVLIDNKEGVLKPGMITKVMLPSQSENVILAPIKSVIQLSSGTTVFIYDPLTGSVSQRSVTTGEIIGDRIQITEGLQVGEKLVVEGHFVLHEGDNVTLDKEEVK